jgi:hypothetical protein
LIKQFRKVASYKTNIKKSVAFLYTSNELAKKEARKTIPFMIASKIPWKKPNQMMNNLCNEN